jgi:hypothetical protein
MGGPSNPTRALRSAWAAIAVSLSLGTLMCSGRENSVDAGSPSDGGGAEDAASEDAHAIITDAGPCGCSYGFHHECPTGEICAASYLRRPFNAFTTCEAMSPARHLDPQLACTLAVPSASAEQAPCNAQCSDLIASPCGNVTPHINVGFNFSAWFRAMETAADPARNHGAPTNADFSLAINDATVPDDCREFLSWTALGLYTLCVGDDAIQNSGDWTPIDGWSFSPIPTVTSSRSTGPEFCRSWVAMTCDGAISEGAMIGSTPGEDAADIIARVVNQCPDGLPFGAPCKDAADGIACVQARLKTIIRALNTPLR